MTTSQPSTGARNRPHYERPELTNLTSEEQRSVTHGEFWIPEAERNVYREALEVLNRAGIPYVVTGLYALYEYTGIYRKTKDLDLILDPGALLDAAAELKRHGFRMELAQAHWLGKAFKNDVMIDLVFGIGNGLSLIDRAWYEHSRPAVLAATPVRVAPAEELIWHRIFISERHRSDESDILHLIFTQGDKLDWKRIMKRMGENWLLLLSQIHFFDYVYPGYRSRIPDWLRRDLLERARQLLEAGDDGVEFRGTLVSRFSFAIDVNEWGLPDLRSEAVAAARTLPIIREICESTVWDAEENLSIAPAAPPPGDEMEATPEG
ncbi:MAG: hypothetical protein ACRELD_08960 [Longimicrobiales bacterium]